MLFYLVGFRLLRFDLSFKFCFLLELELGWNGIMGVGSWELGVERNRDMEIRDGLL